MKKIVFFILVSLFLTGCSTPRKTAKELSENTLSFDKENGGEWEVVVFDPDYTTFLATQPPKEFFTEQVLKTKNIYYVTEWNSRYLQSSAYDRNIYEMRIDYDPDENYGLEFEYRLYMFFKFVEKKYRIKLR